MGSKLGDRIKARLKELGKNQQDLCDITGLEPSQISRIVAGKSSTTPATVVKIAEYLMEAPDEYLRLMGGIQIEWDDPILNSIIAMYNSWSDPKDRELFLQMAELLTRRGKRRENIDAGPLEETGEI